MPPRSAPCWTKSRTRSPPSRRKAHTTMRAFTPTWPVATRARTASSPRARPPSGAVVVPPRSPAVPNATAETAPTQRDRHLQLIAEKGRMGWQKASGYNARARAEATIGRFKRVIGDGLRSRTDERRATEMDVAVQVLNRMLELGRPNYVRIA